MKVTWPPGSLPVIAGLISRGIPADVTGDEVEHNLYCPECDDLNVSSSHISLVTVVGVYDLGKAEVCWGCSD
ncbi:hypothetical protein SEA_BONES_68 [Mycobacterium phage Bones]|nr:hypothetical protein SEA_BONES_68 [Mycobacterium phage Bones]UJD21266.1 hypothetical protein SEA_EYEBALL_71 [Mycobacterium phage Eyeball]